MSEYSLDDVVYVIAIRSRGPKNGQEVGAALKSLRDVVEPVTNPAVAAWRAGDAPTAYHDALRTLGLSFNLANAIVPVVAEGGRTGPSPADGEVVSDAAQGSEDGG